MARVVLKDVEKTYPSGFRAIHGFNLDVADREFVVFVGPSGCGKSTTLRCVAGLEEVTSGTIHIGERLVNDVPPKDRDIAMVFQNYALYPHMTVFENMAFGLKLRKVPAAVIKSKVLAAATVLGIQTMLERKPKTLSGGQRQRVAVGRAIVRDPKCFLFDEPLSNLDAKLRVEMRAEIKRIHLDLQSTTIYVTHDQEEAMTLGDRVVVMKDGVVQQCGPPLEVYHRPQNRFVAGFVGTPPMNFFEGAIVGEGGKLWFDEGTGKLALPSWAAAALVGKVRGSAGAGGADAKVVMGLRPHAISDAPHRDVRMTDNVLPMKVGVIEFLGEKMDVHLSTSVHPHVIAHIDAHRRLTPNDHQPMYFDLNRAHFFDLGELGALLATAPVAA